MDNLFSVFELIAGVYLIYAAISGKGQIYKNDNIKKGMEARYHKTVRVLCAVVGPVMTAQGILDYLYFSAPSPTMHTVTTVMFVLSLLGVGTLFYLTLRMTDRDKVKRQRSGGGTAPRSAFEFDEEDAANSRAGKGNKRK
jgi:threonine/homoserine/homoserine lactone efflux protein